MLYLAQTSMFYFCSKNYFCYKKSNRNAGLDLSQINKGGRGTANPFSPGGRRKHLSNTVHLMVFEVLSRRCLQTCSGVQGISSESRGFKTPQAEEGTAVSLSSPPVLSSFCEYSLKKENPPNLSA